MLRPRAHDLRMVFGVQLLVATNDISILAKTIEVDQLIIKSTKIVQNGLIKLSQNFNKTMLP